MLRVPRPALSLLAGFVLVIASACSASTVSPTPGAAGATATTGAGGPASASSAPTAVAPAANPNDPNSIITNAISGGSAIKSFHIKIVVTGSINEALIASAAGTGGKAPKGTLKLDGSSIEGDVDIANQAAHIAVSLPTVPVTGDVILAGGNLYYKLSLMGPKYTKMSLGSLGSLAKSLPVAVPTPGASAMTSLTDELTQLRAAMVQAGVTATLVGVDQIGGQDAYHINVSIPIAKLNAQIAAAAATNKSAAGVKIDSASFDVWIYKANSRLAKIEIKGASSSIGNIDLVVTITAYDAPVTISAPPASEIGPATP